MFAKYPARLRMFSLFGCLWGGERLYRISSCNLFSFLAASCCLADFYTCSSYAAAKNLYRSSSLFPTISCVPCCDGSLWLSIFPKDAGCHRHPQALSASPITVMASYLFLIWSLIPVLAVTMASVVPIISAPLVVGSYILPWMLYVQMCLV